LTYEEWIEAYIGRFEDPALMLGKCKEAVEEMHAEFPELRVVRGHAVCPAPWGEREHWWLEEQGGRILDPTALQFTAGVHTYREYSEGDPICVGKCRDCGEEIWGDPERFEGYSTDFCNERCANAYMAYLNAPMDGGF
jgi:hypothetical protein